MFGIIIFTLRSACSDMWRRGLRGVATFPQRNPLTGEVFKSYEAMMPGL